MLKTLQITSLIVLILAVCGVVLVVFLGLRKDPEILDYLDSPGVVAQFQNQAKDGEQKEFESPLVAQASAFALRIDPPPPPPPPKVDKPKPKPASTVTRTPPSPPKPPPAPKTVVNAKFSLLATVMCETNPKRSMVLLRQAGGKDEWFWQGEKVGHLDVEEVRNGSAVFSQSGRNPQELFVPEKPKSKSLLKADTGTGVPRTGTGGSISVLVDPESGEPIEAGPAAAAAAAVTGERGEGPAAQPRRSIPTERDADVSAMRQEVSNRIRRIRTVPRPPSPTEQKQSIEQSISSIQEIMNRDEAGMDDAQRQKENEAWMKLLSSLQERKEAIEETPEAADEGDAAAAASEAGDENQPETETPTPDNREE